MAKPKNIINEAADAVDEFIEGLLLQYPNRLAKLEGYAVLLSRNSLESNHVKLISGGGSGHEPSHAGWLGDGMLSAAVCGGIFASPSVASILASIRAIGSHESPCLLIVKNYTGDRLNFGVAASKANQLGIPTRMVVVADDVALPRTKGITGARGVAGTVLVHKLAGAAAMKKHSLDQVVATAEEVASSMGTLGIALDSVTVPGADVKNDRLDDQTIEIGLGIHGEAGLKQSPLLTADDMAREMVTSIQEYGRAVGGKTIPMFTSGDEVIILVNNLGGTSNFEMSILSRSCINLLESAEFGCKVKRVLVGSYMTSFGMHGASLTILNVQGHPEWLDLLDSETGAPSWLPVDRFDESTRLSEALVTGAEELSSTQLTQQRPKLSITEFSTLAKKSLSKASDDLIVAEPLLTKYDTIVGDGDCGITMKRGATEIKNRLNDEKLPTDHPVPLFNALADAVSASMGGTSGILLELLFRKMSCHLASVATVGPKEIASAFQEGVTEVSLVGGAQVGSRTMLDALVPAAQHLVESGSLAEAAKLARKGANETAKMKSASAGRSNYLSEDALNGTPDPGAEAVAIALGAIAGS